MVYTSAPLEDGNDKLKEASILLKQKIPPDARRSLEAPSVSLV